MKKSAIFILTIGSLLFSYCGNQQQTAVEPVPEKVPFILSIPDWALSMSINDTVTRASIKPEVLLDSLDKLKKLDNVLFEALNKNKVIKKFKLIKKLNPCCPCMDGGTGCCLCLAGDEGEGLSFASPTEMQATVTYTPEGGAETEAIKKANVDGVDLFTVPSGISKVRINGRGMPRILEFDFTR